MMTRHTMLITMSIPVFDEIEAHLQNTQVAAAAILAANKQ
jgi:hypothetical protein